MSENEPPTPTPPIQSTGGCQKCGCPTMIRRARQVVVRVGFGNNLEVAGVASVDVCPNCGSVYSPIDVNMGGDAVVTSQGLVVVPLPKAPEPPPARLPDLPGEEGEDASVDGEPVPENDGSAD